MGFIKNLFKKKEEKEPEVSFKEKELSETVQYVGGEPVCEKCGLIIGENHKRRTFNGKKFHLSCFRQVQKEAKVIAFN